MEMYEMPKILGGDFLKAFKQAQERLDAINLSPLNREKRSEPDLICLHRMVTAKETEDYIKFAIPMESSDEIIALARTRFANMIIERMKNEIIDALIAGGYINLELYRFNDMAWRIDMTLAALKPKIILKDDLNLTTQLKAD